MALAVVSRKIVSVCFVLLTAGTLASSVLLNRPTADARAAGAAGQASPDRLWFYLDQGGASPPDQRIKFVTVTNGGTEPLRWQLLPDQPWVYVTPFEGITAARATERVAVAVDVTTLAAGAHAATLTLWDGTTNEALGTVDLRARVCAGPCVFVNVAQASHTVSPLLFGSQIEWLNAGSWIWNRPATATCGDPLLEGGAPRPSIIGNIAQLGVRLLRYPGGIPSDFFRWAETVGPVISRIPQINPWKSTVLWPVRECPVFGPDEFSSLAAQLGTEILITANAGTGNAQQAADWLDYYRQRNVAVSFWEVGNEVYLPGIPVGDPNGFPYAFAGAYMPAAEYAAAFDEYARTLRQADPAAKVGLVATAYSTPWNEEMLTAVQEPADFMALHLIHPLLCVAYQPSETVFRALLAAPDFLRVQIGQARDAAAAFAGDINKRMKVAVTEHGPLFPACGGPFEWLRQSLNNQTLGAALFSALSYHVFLRDPDIVLATHQNLVNPLFQALVAPSAAGAPLRSAFQDVFRLYAQTAGGTFVPGSVLNAPRFSSQKVGSIPPMTDVPALDAIAVLSPGPTLRVFVVNRSLYGDVSARMALDAFPGAIASIETATVNGPSFDSVNFAWAPNTVTLKTALLPAEQEFDVTLPAHSLVVFTVR